MSAPTTATANQTAAIRRLHDQKVWGIANGDRSGFTDQFGKGLISSPRFVSDAARMVCGYRRNSTGEVLGTIEGVGDAAIMPEGIVSVGVAYNRDHQLFHVRGQSHHIVEKADFLLLNEDGTALAGWKEAKDAPRSGLRRYKGVGAWLVAHHGRHEAQFESGLLVDVRFVHKAERMTCGTVDSTGEATGVLVSMNGGDMPAVGRVEVVTYDAGKRLFVGKSGRAVDSADYLVLKGDGTSVAGWKN